MAFESAMIAAAALVEAAGFSVPPAAGDTDEIVVRAVKDKCRVQIADRLLTDREFDQRAKGWAGKPLRVVEPRGADYKCLAKIVFHLYDKGVRLVQFVDQPAQDEAARPR